MIGANGPLSITVNQLIFSRIYPSVLRMYNAMFQLRNQEGPLHKNLWENQRHDRIAGKKWKFSRKYNLHIIELFCCTKEICWEEIQSIYLHIPYTIQFYSYRPWCGIQGVSYWNGSLKRLKHWPDISALDEARKILNINPAISGFVSNLNLIRKIASQSNFANLSLSSKSFIFKCLVILKCQTIGHDAPHRKSIFFPEVWCTAMQMVHFDTISSGFEYISHVNWRRFPKSNFSRTLFSWRFS